MNSELDLVRTYMNADDVSPDELAVARSILEDAISAEVELDRPADLRAIVPPRHRWSTRRRLRWGVGGAVAVPAAIALILQVVPTSTVSTPQAAAAEISRLADVVQPVPPLRSGEWYHYQSQGALSANVSTGTTTPGGTPTLEAEASIPITVGEWSNSTGAICTSQQFGTATFSGSANAQAWHALGLSDTPANQPTTDCSAGLEASVNVGSSFAPIDVSSMTHDPTTLAAELQGRTTGIRSIDQYAVGEPVNQAAFERLAVILVSPTSGQWSGFGQEMLKTMALLPGVISLGRVTSHSGMSGLAFTAQTDVTINPKDGAVVSSLSPPTVILDPQSGAVLEARNLDFPVLSSAAQDFVGSPSALVYSQGAAYGVTAQWIDPVGDLSVVAQDAIPSWTSTYHIIEAVTKASTTETQISEVVNPFLGNGNIAYSDQSVPGAGQETFDITILGTVTNEQTVVSALTASELFASVTVKL